ncbi:unnamed protein product [Allacma fusca]|uniref:SPX domain-containing protein n=1 Tax=Allacma fusca TaxID=39272 RepID=A0A8J2PRD2_9HEXA|nr:unnamed protein product [Allacma fusca]
MKFSDTLNDKENPAWKSYYLNYTELRELLYDGIAKAPKITNAADIGRYDYVQYVSRFDHGFLKMCQHELEKVNKFYKEKSRECNYKFTEIKQDAEIVQSGVDQENPQAD